MLTARYGLIPYIQQIKFRLLKVDIPLRLMCVTRVAGNVIITYSGLVTQQIKNVCRILLSLRRIPAVQDVPKYLIYGTVFGKK